jgi:hypothetical protein
MPGDSRRTPLRSALSGLWRAFQAFDAIEFTVAVTLGALLLIVGPVVVVRRFVGQGHHVIAGVLAILWIWCLVTCVRDLQRGTLGPVSWGLVTTWVAATFAIGLWFLW